MRIIPGTGNGGELLPGASHGYFLVSDEVVASQEPFKVVNNGLKVIEQVNNAL